MHIAIIAPLLISIGCFGVQQAPSPGSLEEPCDPTMKIMPLCSGGELVYGDSGFRPRYPCENPSAEFLRYLRKGIQDRVVVTRKRDAKTPTWDGYTRAFIVDPTIWYFDPDSRVQQMRGKGIWPEPAKDLVGVPRENDESGARRNILDFMLELETKAPNYGFTDYDSTYLFR
jgi:hypothetical protein